MKLSRAMWLLLLVMMAASWTQVQAQLSVTDVIPVPCDDRAVEKLARLALSYVNEDRSVGYKFTLNRVLNVHLHAQGPAGKVYYLDLDVLETKCHVRSPRPWKRCDIRPFMETVRPPHLSNQPEKLLKTCPDCPLLLSVESAEALWAAQHTLRKYNTQSPLGSHFRLQSIARASQSAAVQGTFVEYTIEETECSLEQEDAGICKPADLNRETAGFCTGAVYGNGKTETDVQVSCEIFLAQGVGMSNSAAGGAGRKQVPDALPAQHEKPPNKVPKDPNPKDPQPRPSDPVQKGEVHKSQRVKPTPSFQTPIVLEDPNTPIPPAPTLTISGHSSESSSNSESSESFEELGTIIARPPQDFRYKFFRPKRQASPSQRPEHIPEFLSVFPSAPSPFRSCPGAPRYTTA
ncbi:fetuin-B-like [Scleropages formosus]|uniref:Fetuin-B-like n=1 Tax=Scleropages formosus TaxID=113540 RepID=A0A0P7W0V2_SCLFO|nr:fetuin-B-like [Scleropages formosus]